MELTALVQAAQAASPMERIAWRDRIAAYGTRAIEAMGPWLADPTLAAFAIRVIERAGANADAPEAIRVLRSARSRVPPVVKGDLDWALKRLRPRADPDARTAPPPAVPRSVRRERPHMSTAARQRPR